MWNERLTDSPIHRVGAKGSEANLRERQSLLKGKSLRLFNVWRNGYHAKGRNGIPFKTHAIILAKNYKLISLVFKYRFPYI